MQAQIPAPELPGGPNEREPRRPRAASEHWSIRLRDLLSTYLPLLLMLLLAALTATFFSLVDMTIRFGLKLIVGEIGRAHV